MILKLQTTLLIILINLKHTSDEAKCMDKNINIESSNLEKAIENSQYDILVIANKSKEFIDNKNLINQSISRKNDIYVYDLHAMLDKDLFNNKNKKLFALGANIFTN